MIIVSIGILAHNEAASIGAIIEDIAQQTIFSNQDSRFSIHVVANGCRDDTVDSSWRALRLPALQRSNLSYYVHDLPKAGKANAWNEFIHSFADQNSDYVFLVDADIRLLGDTTLKLMLDNLNASPGACVAVDEPVKDVLLKPNKTILDKLILTFSRTTHDFRTAIAGSLYCARFETVRRIWLPIGIIGEDGFLRAMILTSNFTQPENAERLIFVKGARHSFETRRNIADILHHQVRLAMGTGLNVLLFRHLRRKLQDLDSAESYIKNMNEADPRWVNSLVAEEVGRGKYFIMHWGFVSRRFKHFQSLTFVDKVIKFPIYLSAALMDFFVFFIANRIMRKGGAEGFW